MARITRLACFLLLVYFEQLKAFSYPKTINVVMKSSNEMYDYILGPEFFVNGKFAFSKIKELDETPPAIEVSLEIYDESVSAVSTSKKKFVADIGSTAINVTSMKCARYTTILSIAEKPKYGETKAMLVKWDPFGYPDPKLYLPMDHIIVSSSLDFAVFVRDTSFCRNYNTDICWIRLSDGHDPQKNELVHDDLVWPNIYIDYTREHNGGRCFVRGFDADGNYKLLDCPRRSSGSDDCTKLLTLSNASREIEAYSLNNGLCYIKNPGKDYSVTCLELDSYNKKIADRIVSYEKPISLLAVKDCSWYSEIIIVTNEIHCHGTDCSNIVLSKIPYDSSKPIIQRHLALGCSVNEKIFKVSIVRNEYNTAIITLEYICESDFKFTFKSITINNGWFVNTTESVYTLQNI